MVLSAIQAAPGDTQPYDEIYAQPGLLYEAGVKFAFSTGNGSNARHVPFHAALAVAPLTWEWLVVWAIPIERRFPLRIFLFLVLWMPAAIGAFAATQDSRNPESIQAGPYETLPAAEYLKAHAAGATLFARKPHVAFLAGMNFAPLPQVDSPAALHQAAVHAGARYLLVSGAELSLRAGVRPFAAPDARVPGFRRVFESEGALVYEVLPDSAAPAP